MNATRRTRVLLAGALAVIAIAGAAAQSGPSGLEALRRAFVSPPDEARIMMRWWWFGPTVTKATLEREMRLMKEGGIGGFEIQPVYPVVLDDPARGLVTHPFLSDAFLDHVRFTAAKARELGLRVDLTVGSGWPYGGPQVAVSQAAGKLRIERAVVPSGAGHAPVPDIRTGERLIAAFLAPAAPATTTKDLREVSAIDDGRLVLPDRSPQAREVLFFVSSRSGMMVKRPAVGAEGFVLNHYDRAAVDHYLRVVGDRLLSAFDAPPYAVFCDSLEVYESDWTDDLLDAFKARRGYDLRPLLPALVLDAGTASASIRHDWGLTLTELLDERFLAPMQSWARARGTKFRIQGYGIPPATISGNAGIDLPEGEGARWTTLTSSRWASSIGHLFGRPVVSSETWTWLHSPSFRATPLDVKAEADLHFLQGINQLIGHGWPYTADGVADPGWRFYAAGVFNDRNPWWTVMPDVSRYLQRVSFLLRQGRPVNDIAVYVPNDDGWAAFVPGKVGSFLDALSRRIGPDLLPAILAAGFNADFVDDAVLADRAAADQGAIVIGRNRYRALVLPGVERMPPATLRAIEGFARQGVRVVATRRTPALAPGYLAAAADHAAVKDTADRLFTGQSPAGAFVERDADAAAAIAGPLVPGMAVSAGRGDIGFVHREFDGADLYFVVNTANERRAFDATFRPVAASAQRWDAVTGAIRPVTVRRPEGRPGTTVALDLGALRVDGCRVERGRAGSCGGSSGGAGPAGAGRPQYRLASRLRTRRSGRRVARASLVDRRRGDEALLGCWNLREDDRRTGGISEAGTGGDHRPGRTEARDAGRPGRADAGLARRARPRGGGGVRERPPRRLRLVPAVCHRCDCPPAARAEPDPHRGRQPRDQPHGRARAARLQAAEPPLRHEVRTAGHGQGAARSRRAVRADPPRGGPGPAAGGDGEIGPTHG